MFVMHDFFSDLIRKLSFFFIFNFMVRHRKILELKYQSFNNKILKTFFEVYNKDSPGGEIWQLNQLRK